MTSDKSLPPGVVTTSVAAALIGVTVDRIGQLVRSGHAVSPARGQVVLASLLRGYVASLRTSAARPASAALARQQSAKAALITETTEARMAEVMPRHDAEQSVRLVVDVALKRIRALAKPGNAALRDLPPDVAAAVRREALAAVQKIEAARATALRALATGDLTEIEGKA